MLLSHRFNYFFLTKKSRLHFNQLFKEKTTKKTLVQTNQLSINKKTKCKSGWYFLPLLNFNVLQRAE